MSREEVLNKINLILDSFTDEELNVLPERTFNNIKLVIKENIKKSINEIKNNNLCERLRKLGVPDALLKRQEYGSFEARYISEDLKSHWGATISLTDVHFSGGGYLDTLRQIEEKTGETIVELCKYNQYEHTIDKIDDFDEYCEIRSDSCYILPTLKLSNGRYIYMLDD